MVIFDGGFLKIVEKKKTDNIKWIKQKSRRSMQSGILDVAIVLVQRVKNGYSSPALKVHIRLQQSI